MLVMVANNTGVKVGYLAGKFEGKIGHLYSPGAQTGPYRSCHSVLIMELLGMMMTGTKITGLNFLTGRSWVGKDRFGAWFLMWLATRAETLRRWKSYSPIAMKYGWPLAFAVQDGMIPKDVPDDASVVFVGGSTKWKWQTMAMWCREFRRVHIGRVNTYRRLWDCHDAGAESVGRDWMDEWATKCNIAASAPIWRNLRASVSGSYKARCLEAFMQYIFLEYSIRLRPLAPVKSPWSTNVIVSTAIGT